MSAARAAADSHLRQLAADVVRHVSTQGLPSDLSAVETRERRDPWGRPPVLEREGETLRVRSLGPDGVPRTADDRVIRVPVPAQALSEERAGPSGA